MGKFECGGLSERETHGEARGEYYTKGKSQTRLFDGAKLKLF